jgi:hypothetical protein
MAARREVVGTPNAGSCLPSHGVGAMTRGTNDDNRGLPTPERRAADADSTNVAKRLKDNQPLSDTDEVRDEKMGERRQYGMHDVGEGDSARTE